MGKSRNWLHRHFRAPPRSNRPKVDEPWKRLPYWRGTLVPRHCPSQDPEHYLKTKQWNCKNKKKKWSHLCVIVLLIIRVLFCPNQKLRILRDQSETRKRKKKNLLIALTKSAAEGCRMRSRKSCKPKKTSAFSILPLLQLLAAPSSLTTPTRWRDPTQLPKL